MTTETKKKPAASKEGRLGKIRTYVMTADVWDQVIDADTPFAYATAKDADTGRPMSWAVDGAIVYSTHPLTKRPLLFAVERHKGDLIPLPERHPHVLRLTKPRKYTRAVLELAGENELNQLDEIDKRQAELERQRDELQARIAELQAQADASLDGAAPEDGEIREAPHDSNELRLS